MEGLQLVKYLFCFVYSVHIPHGWSDILDIAKNWLNMSFNCYLQTIVSTPILLIDVTNCVNSEKSSKKLVKYFGFNYYFRQIHYIHENWTKNNETLQYLT